MNASGYCDLNVTYNGDNPEELIRHWHENLYKTIALNRTIDLAEVDEMKKKKKNEKFQIFIPEPAEIVLPDNLKGKITVLNRLTIKVADPSKLSLLFQSKASTLKKYDILAAIPMEQACVQLVCSMNDLDVISMDCVSKPEWKLTRKLYNFSVEQNKYLEIPYSPAVRDSSTLKNTIFMAHEFYSVGKAKNLIISSSTSNRNLLRSPYEVIFLSLIFGLDENKARNAISMNSNAVVSRAYYKQLIFTNTNKELLCNNDMKEPNLGSVNTWKKEMQICSNTIFFRISCKKKTRENVH